MPSTQDFLQAILPDEGYKCLVIFRDGKPRHQWFTDFEKMEMAALAADAQGATVYHGCSSFRTTGPRKADNALSAKSLWLEIDAGPAKPYPDARGAYVAAEAFRRAASLPEPLYVRSGAFGLHLYWPLTVGLHPSEWLDYANGLKAFCRLHGLQADPARTADLASILRPPGTHNRKGGGEVEVVCGPLVGPYDIRDFASLRVAPSVVGGSRAFLFRGVEPRGLGLRPVHTGTEAGRPRIVADAIGQAIKEAFERPSHAANIAANCQQLQRISRSVAAGDRRSEPEWHAACGVLAYAIDGDESARLWARGYDGYDEASTSAWVQSKLDRARTEVTGPITCQHFIDLDPAGCAGCPHAGKITSPIQLGYKDETVSSVVAVGGAVPSEPNSDLPDPPPNFKWDEGRLVFAREDKNGGAAYELVSAYPIYLESVGNAEVEEDAFSYNFRLKLPMGDRVIALPAQRFHGPDGIAYMQGRGAVIHDKDHFRKYVMAAVDTFNRDQKPAVRYEQFGWKDSESAFLWGRHLYTPANVLPASAVDEVATRGKLLAPGRGGSLDRWSAAANKLFARDCEPHAFALLCAFAAPLMRFHSTDEGGAILALVGPPGSMKSTALDAAGSVWGQHRALDLNTFDTRVARGVTLGVLGNLPVLYDEMEKQDADILREFVDIFTNGRDRARGTAEGGIRHESRTWQTIVIAAANRSIVELVQRNDDRDGLSCRILELPGHLPAGMTDAEGTALRNEMKANCGYAAEPYVKMLVQPEIVAWVKRTLADRTAEVWKRTHLDSKHRFWVRTIGSVWVAALLAEKLGLLAFSPKRLIDWVIDRVKVDDRLANLDDDLRRSCALLSEFMNAHVDGMISVAGPWRHNGPFTPIQNRPRHLVIRHERKNDRFLIAEKPFREWLARKAISAKQILDDLDGTVLIRRRCMATLGAGTDIPGGQVACIEVNGAHPALSGVLAAVDEPQAKTA